MPILNDSLTARAAELAGRREPFVRATVVRAAHPTSAHAGNTALIDSTGVIDGFVGGNCVEASVRKYSLMVLATHDPLLLRVVPGEPSGLHQEGAVEVTNPCLSGGEIEIFLEPQLPPPRVLVVGSTPVAHALAILGAGVGFDVVLGDTITPHVTDAAVIVASHGHDEEPSLEAALRGDVPYVALVASEQRGAAVLASLSVSDEQRSRVFSPAGLSLGARTPGEIALAILAQLVAERARDRPAALPSNRPGAVATAIDPVCSMTVAAVPASLHVEHEGHFVYFCSTGCRTSFIADPQAYARAS